MDANVILWVFFFYILFFYFSSGSSLLQGKTQDNDFSIFLSIVYKLK